MTQECKCDEVLNLLEKTRNEIKEVYSKYSVVNADFIRASKAMFFERVDKLFKDVAIKDEGEK
jgi:hypothetical protein